MTEDFVGVYFVAVGASFDAAGFLATILAIRSLRLLHAFFILATLLIAYFLLFS